MGMETAWDGENPFVVFLILMCREYKKLVSGPITYNGLRLPGETW
jgi:hypothetical protein